MRSPISPSPVHSSPVDAAPLPGPPTLSWPGSELPARHAVSGPQDRAFADVIDRWLDPSIFTRLPLLFESGWSAAQAFLKYRRSGGTKTSPMPDFYIGAHAEYERLTRVTRDPKRYRTYFPNIRLIAPP